MLVYFLIFVVGLCVGSFLNVIICRLPEKRPIVKGRSACPHCKEIIKPHDLLPLVSFCALKGRCRQCKKKISWQYPLIELASGLIFLGLAYYYQIANSAANAFFYRDIVFLAALLVIFVTDLRYYLIFDAVTLPMALFSFVVNVFLFGSSADYIAVAVNLFLSGLIAASFFALQYFLSKGKWIGGGDIRLGLLIGLMLGWPKILLAMFLAYILGAIISLFLLIAKKKRMKSEVPFGVFLSAATAISLFFGDKIIAWYLSLLGV